MGFFSEAFGIHEASLAVASRRSQVLASNLANADTPNYKARDISFKEVLERQLAGPAPRGENPGLAGTSAQQLQYRVPYNPSLDGNTVETDVEQAEFSQNAVRYQASLNFINGRIQSLRLAITGGR